MTWLIPLAVGIVASLLATELTDVAPRLARRLVRWAAYRWSSDVEIAAGYAEEWSAVVADRPGRMSKLVTALSFAGGGISRAISRHMKLIAFRAARKLRRRSAGPTDDELIVQLYENFTARQQEELQQRVKDDRWDITVEVIDSDPFAMQAKPGRPRRLLVRTTRRGAP